MTSYFSTDAIDSTSQSDKKKTYSEEEHAKDNTGKTSTGEPIKDVNNFISKEELIRDINIMLKMKFNKKIMEKLDLETMKKLSKGKLSELLEEAQSDIQSAHKTSNTYNLEKLYEGLKNIRFEHRDDNDYSDELESEESMDGSTEYDELGEVEDE